MEPQAGFQWASPFFKWPNQSAAWKPPSPVLERQPCLAHRVALPWHLFLHEPSELTVGGWTVFKGQPTVICNPSTSTVGVRQKGFLLLVWIITQAFKNTESVLSAQSTPANVNESHTFTPEPDGMPPSFPRSPRLSRKEYLFSPFLCSGAEWKSEA